MLARADRSSSAGRHWVAHLTAGVWAAFALVAMTPPWFADDVPGGTPSLAAMRDWERIEGTVETATVRVVYELRVRPERNGIYTITRYRIRHKDTGNGAAARDESEKYIWNVTRGEPLRCFARERDGWRALAHRSSEYQTEMLTAMSVYALHREATLARARR